MKKISTEQYFAMVRQMLAETGRAYVRVTGNSMLPLLHHLRDGVVIIPPERIRMGDIVLFDRRNGRYALHRVIVRGKRGFVMAGDNQWHFERDLHYDQVVGVVESIHRNGRYVSTRNLLLKIYSWTVTLLTFPRIYGYKTIRYLLRPFRPGSQQKGTS